MDRTIVFDNGSGLFKAGWAAEASPSIVTEPIVHRLKARSNGTTGLHHIFIGALPNLRAERARSPFESGVVVAPDLLENVFDFGLATLGYNPDRNPDARLVICEPLGNPRHARGIAQELVFEGCGFSAASFGVDVLFAKHSNAGPPPSENRLDIVVSIGSSSTTLVIYDENGHPMLSLARRLSVGWDTLVHVMQHATTIKYPEFPHVLGAHDYSNMVQEHARIALDYPSELMSILHRPDDDIVLQYPVVPRTASSSNAFDVLTDKERTACARDRPAFLSSFAAQLAELSKRTGQRGAIASSSRKKSDAQSRIRVMTTLLDDEDVPSKPKPGARRRAQQSSDDRFGDDVRSWNVYNELSKEGAEEAEEEVSAEIARLERVLAELDPNQLHRVSSERQSRALFRLTRGAPLQGASDDERALRWHQLRLNVECVRVPECLFNPALGGVDEAGLAEQTLSMIQSALSMQRVTRAIGIVCTGGGSLLNGLCERLEKELRADIPDHIAVHVSRMSDPMTAAWRGASQATRDGSLKFSTRSDHFEHGPDRLAVHPFSNTHA
ncbi:hypothetical protein BC828DRAFT_390880 [Blastocladiella britannica]|nr:hypothetical protein BC828DRAFT_390880 [Blastocladiella britannica]